MSLKSANKTDTNVYTLEIEIDPKSFRDAIVKSYNKAKNKIVIHGFRKGKAPLAIIEKVYGKDVFYEDALELLFPEVVADAYKEAGITAVDSPRDVDVKTIGEDGVLFEIKVTVKPEDVKVSAYKGLEAEKEEVSVTAEEVEADINRRREQNSRTVSVEDRAAQDGDITVIDFEGFVDGKAFEGGKGENYNLTLGSGQFIPGFEEQIVGHNIGDSFDINVKFPEEYAPELAGKDAVFKITLHEIKVKELPELDDEFAKDLGEYDTVEELKKGVEKEILDRKQSEADKAFEAKVMEALVANVEADIPEVMFDNRKEENINNFSQRIGQQGIDLDTYLSYMGMDKEAFEASMREQAVSQVKLDLAFEKIAEIEKIEVSAEDIDAEYAKLAEMYGIEVEKIKNLIAEDMLKADLLTEKVMNFVTENAKAVKPGKKPAAKKAPAKKAAAKKDDEAEAEKKPAAKKAPAKKAAAKKDDEAEAEKKPAAKKAPAKKAAAKKDDEAEAEKKPAAKKAPAKKAAAKKDDEAEAEKKPAAKKTTAKKKAEDAE